MVTTAGLEPMAAKVKAIAAMPPPDAVGPLRSVLGFFNYYRHFVPQFSSIAKPLTTLLQQGVTWVWGIDQQHAFDQLKAALCVEGLALRRPHPDRKFILHTDWCLLGIGAVLGQLDEQGKEYMIACSSRSLNKHEGNYEPWKGELLALVWGVRHFRVYLLGVQFLAVTDHRPLLWMLTQPSPVGQLYRWVLILQEFTYDVVHREGAKHQNADALSRLPLASTADHTGARLDHESDPLVCHIPKVTTCYDVAPVEVPVADIPTTLEELRAAMRRPWTPPSALVGEPAAAGLAAAVIPSATAASQGAGGGDVLGAVMAASACIVPLSAALRSAASDSDMLGIGWHYDAVTGQPDAAGGQSPSAVLSPQQDASAVLQAAATLYTAKAMAVAQLVPACPPVLSVMGSTGVDLTLISPSFFSQLPAGLVLLELFGGLGAGLEAVLRAGWPVAQYYYVDIDPAAQAVARYRGAALCDAYPHLLPPAALSAAFTTLPDDVYAITPAHLQWLVQRRPGQWLVVGGWECQDLSPAGSSKGLRGVRSSTFYPLRDIIVQLQMLCAQQQAPPPAYILENTAFQYNWRSCRVAEEDFAAVTAELGQPMVLDAAQFNSYAHRLRNFWSNLIQPAEMAALCQVIRRAPNLLAEDVLGPGRVAAEVTRDDQPPYYPANKRGQPRAAFPTIMAYPNTRSTRPGQPGAIKDLTTGTVGELTAAERERAMGYDRDTTAAPGVTEQQRRTILGRCIDINTLSHICALAAAVDQQRVAQHPQCASALRPHMHLEQEVVAVSAPVSPDGGIAAALAAACPAADDANTEPSPAEQAEVDIWEDAPVLELLRTGVRPTNLTAKEVARVLGRAARYQWEGGQLLRKWQDGGVRQVPPADQRLALVRQHHDELGHFGVKRTISLLLHNYWWRGLSSMVKQYVQACVLCSRGNAKFTNANPTLQPLPISGPGYRWNLDLAGPLPTTERGNCYVLVAVEAFTKWAVLVPLRDKTPESTAFAYLHAVYGYYGGSAELVTDRGGEWAGQFHTQLAKLKVDHRHTSAQHPQGNGMAERVVGILKGGLSKYCAAALEKLRWDWLVPPIMLGYNSSKQASTRLSPFQLMHGITPTLPAQLRGVFAVAVDLDPSSAADVFWHRAMLLHKLGGVAWQNLHIAAHRDTLRYARVRGGAYLPELLQLEPGVLVYLRTQRPTGLSLPAQSTVLQVVQVRPSGVVLLLGGDGNVTKHRIEQLTPCHLPNVRLTINRQLQYSTEDTRCVSCGSADRGDVMLLCDQCGTGQHTFCLNPPLSQVPKGMWLCPTCVASGYTPDDVKRQQQEWDRQQAQQRQRERLTPSMEQAAALDGAWLRYQQPGAAGWRRQVNYGQLTFLGINAAGNPHFCIKYQCGQQEELTLKGINSKFRKLLPAGTEPPVANAGMALQLATIPAGLGGMLVLLHQPPWPVRSRAVRARLKLLWPLALTESAAYWAAQVWLAPTLAGWLAEVRQHCWWATVRLAPRRVPEPPLGVPPLLLTIDTGAAVAELVEAALVAAAPAVLCVLVAALRPGQVQALRDMQGTMVVPVADGWVVWWWPSRAQLHVRPALCQVAGLLGTSALCGMEPMEEAFVDLLSTTASNLSQQQHEQLEGVGVPRRLRDDPAMQQLLQAGLLQYPDASGSLAMALAARPDQAAITAAGAPLPPPDHLQLGPNDVEDICWYRRAATAILVSMELARQGVDQLQLVRQNLESAAAPADTDERWWGVHKALQHFPALLGLQHVHDTAVELCAAELYLPADLQVHNLPIHLAYSLAHLLAFNLWRFMRPLCEQLAEALVPLLRAPGLTVAALREGALPAADPEHRASLHLAFQSAFPQAYGCQLLGIQQKAQLWVAVHAASPDDLQLLSTCAAISRYAGSASEQPARAALQWLLDWVRGLDHGCPWYTRLWEEEAGFASGRLTCDEGSLGHALLQVAVPCEQPPPELATLSLACMAADTVLRSTDPFGRMDTKLQQMRQVYRHMGTCSMSVAAAELGQPGDGLPGELLTALEAVAGVHTPAVCEGTRARCLRQLGPLKASVHAARAAVAAALEGGEASSIGWVQLALALIAIAGRVSASAHEVLGPSSRASAMLGPVLVLCQWYDALEGPWRHVCGLMTSRVRHHVLPVLPAGDDALAALQAPESAFQVWSPQQRLLFATPRQDPTPHLRPERVHDELPAWAHAADSCAQRLEQRRGQLAALGGQGPPIIMPPDLFSPGLMCGHVLPWVGTLVLPIHTPLAPAWQQAHPELPALVQQARALANTLGCPTDTWEAQQPAGDAGAPADAGEQQQEAWPHPAPAASPAASPEALPVTPPAPTAEERALWEGYLATVPSPSQLVDYEPSPPPEVQALGERVALYDAHQQQRLLLQLPA